MLITVPADKQERFATGHDINLDPVTNKKIQALAGATGICSSENDISDIGIHILNPKPRLRELELSGKERNVPEEVYMN